MKSTDRKFIRILGIFLVISMFISTFAINLKANTDDNVHFGPAVVTRLINSFKIDMTYAPDNTKIPNVTFSIEVIEVNDDAKWGIGQEIPSLYGFDPLIIERGNTDGLAIHVSDVTFNENDQYFDDIGQFLNGDIIDYDNLSARHLVFDSLLKNAWGELLTDNESEKAFFRAPTAEEKADEALMQLGRDNNWPEDVIGYRSIYPFTDNECLYDYDFNTFRYSQQFGLLERGSIGFIVNDYNKDILLKNSLDAEGNYLSVSKSMFGPGDVERLIDQILEKNPPQDVGKLYRFILKPAAPADEHFEINQQEKIMDVFVSEWGYAIVRIFDTVEQATAFYSENDYEYDPSYHCSEFVMHYKPPVVEEEVPPTGDRLTKMVVTVMAVAAVTSLIALVVIKTAAKKKKED